MLSFHAGAKGFLAFTLAAAAALPATGGREQAAKDPIQWSIKAAVPDKPLQAGDAFTVQLLAAIEDGWHLYSTEQAEGGPIPTRISMPPDQPFEQSGSIEASEPRSALDPNFNLTTEYYEGQAAFYIPVKVAAGAASGKSLVKVNVYYQTCNDQICLPPKTVKLSAEVRIGTSARW